MDNPMTDDQLLDVLRAVLADAEGQRAIAEANCTRYRKAIDVLTSPSAIVITEPRPSSLDNEVPGATVVEQPAKRVRTANEKAADAARKRRARTGHKPTRTPSVDPDQIAATIDELKAAGSPVVPGLADRFGVPTTTAKNWATRYRKTRTGGLITKSTAPVFSEDPAPFVVPASVVGAEQVRGKRSECEECDYAAGNIDAMRVHTLKAHSRAPRISERTPHTYDVKASA